MKKKATITFELEGDSLDRFEEMMKEADQTPQEILKNSFALFEYVLEQTKSGTVFFKQDVGGPVEKYNFFK